MKRLTASGDAARDAVARISRGSSILTDRITTGAGEWVRAGRRDDLTGIPAALGCWARAGMLAGGAYGLYEGLHAVPNTMWGATAVWCWKAWHATAPPKDPADDQEQPERSPAVDLTKPSAPTREQLVAALHEVADPHAHLAALARHLGTTPGRVREGLDRDGIPVAGGVRAGGRVSTGVKRDHFPALPATPGPPVVAGEAAGQPDNNNSNNADGRTAYLSREGFWTEPDPNRPSGWTVVRHP